MKLCHIVPSLEEQHGGPSKSVSALCHALATAGHHVDLFTTRPGALRSGSVEREVDPRIISFRRDWPDRLCRSAGLRSALMSETPEIVHHHSIWLRTLDYARAGAKRAKAALVLSPRGMMSRWAWHHHHWRKQIAMQLVHPGAFSAVAGWHVTSPEEEQEIRALGYTEPICVAPNGVDEPTPDDIASATAYWNTECPETATRPVALFYSRFHPKKRVLELIDLWLEKAPTDWLLLLVGIPQEYSPEMLDRYVVNMSGSGRVRAFNGIGRPPPYAVASLFLLPSHSENFGMAIAEAMAHRVPVVVTDSTPWSEVNTQQCGWCVAWGQFGSALTAATAETGATLRARGEKARAWVLEKYSWRHTAEKLSEFYARLRPAVTR